MPEVCEPVSDMVTSKLQRYIQKLEYGLQSKWVIFMILFGILDENTCL